MYLKEFIDTIRNQAAFDSRSKLVEYLFNGAMRDMSKKIKDPDERIANWLKKISENSPGNKGYEHFFSIDDFDDDGFIEHLKSITNTKWREIQKKYIYLWILSGEESCVDLITTDEEQFYLSMLCQFKEVIKFPHTALPKSVEQDYNMSLIKKIADKLTTESMTTEQLIKINQILYEQETPSADKSEYELLTEMVPYLKRDSDKFITDSNNECFKGYVNKELDVYFIDTKSYDPEFKNREDLHKGSLTLSHENGYCKVVIKINSDNTKRYRAKSNFDKTYSGIMVYLSNLDCFSCTLTCEKNGDISNVIFTHRAFTNEESFSISLATVNTVTPGNHEPVMHRMLICKKDSLNFDLIEHEIFIRTQLKMNRSPVYISVNNFNKIKQYFETAEQNKDTKEYLSIINDVKELTLKEEPYYKIYDNDIFMKIIDNASDYGISTEKCYKILTLLRFDSLHSRYNKIGRKFNNDVLYKYASKYQNKTEEDSLIAAFLKEKMTPQ